MQRKWPIVIACVVLGVVCVPLAAALAQETKPAFTSAKPVSVQVEGMFGSNMVLQRGVPITVKGTAGPGEKLKLAFAGDERTCEVDSAGRWSMSVGPLEASAQAREMKIAGPRNTVTFRNVLVGDVWVFAGQSNMAMTLGKARGGQKEAESAKYPEIRVFGAHYSAAREPLERASGGWQEVEPKMVQNMSAVAYYFAREVNKNAQVPVGLVGSSVSGSMAEIWMSRSAMENDPGLKAYLGVWDKVHEGVKVSTQDPKNMLEVDGAPVTREAYAQKFRDWRAAGEKAAKEGKEPGKKFPALLMDFPRPAPPLPGTIDVPASAFNSVIGPMTSYPVKGAIWYQGESNVGRLGAYEETMRLLIEDWRARWGVGEFPFLMVQLPNYKNRPGQPGWAAFREAQMKLAKRVPNVHVAVTIDTATVDNGDLHPTNKEPVGQRLALLALKHAYGKEMVAMGPVYRSMKVEGGAVRITFDNAAGGLVSGGKPPGFMVAGADGKFVPAEVVVEGETVLVKSAEVAAPAAVRYAWEDYPVTDLFNKAGLPAAPFRTDGGGR